MASSEFGISFSLAVTYFLSPPKSIAVRLEAYNILSKK